jgi:hypothetical protein
MRRYLGAACFAAVGGFAMLAGHAQEADAPKAEAAPIVLQAAHLFDGKSGQLVSPGRIVVRGTKIEAVGRDVAVPAGAQVIDLGDATLVPGYIDAHTHIVGDYDESWTRGFYNSMMRLSVEQSFHAQANAKATLEAGVTTAPATTSTWRCAMRSPRVSSKARACWCPCMPSAQPAAIAMRPRFRPASCVNSEKPTACATAPIRAGAPCASSSSTARTTSRSARPAACCRKATLSTCRS